MKIVVNDFENIAICRLRMLYVICLIKIVLRCLYINDGSIFMLYQQKIKNELNCKSTLKYNPEPDRTNRYGFEGGKHTENTQRYFIETNIFMKIY